jgi:hypothetical protein
MLRPVNAFVVVAADLFTGRRVRGCPGGNREDLNRHWQRPQECRRGRVRRFRTVQMQQRRSLLDSSDRRLY